MNYFPSDKRNVLLDTLRLFFGDEHILASSIASWSKSPRTITINDIYEGNETVRKMIIEDAAIIHLLIELHREGKIIFSKKTDENEVLAIAKELLVQSKKAENAFTDLLKFRDVPWDIPRTFIMYKNKLELLIASENAEITELESKIRGATISEQKVFSVQEKNLRIELHKNLRTINYLVPDSLTKSAVVSPFGLLVFLDNILVAEVRIAHYEDNCIQVDRSIVYLRGLGFVQRAIKILLKLHTIDLWKSDDSLTFDAQKMYATLKKDSELIVTESENRFLVKRA